MSEDSFKDHIMDLLAPSGGVTARAMFGGFGIYKGGVMFGLIADDELFFKVDDASRDHFQARKSKPFVYQSKDKAVTMPGYWLVPESILEDADQLKMWVTRAYDVALKARKAAGNKPKPRRAGPNAKHPRPRRR